MRQRLTADRQKSGVSARPLEYSARFSSLTRISPVYYQEQIAKGTKAAVLQLGEAPGHLLSRRPFQVNWIATQVMICLSLWNYDRSLVHALELAKSFLIPLDVLNALWPSTGTFRLLLNPKHHPEQR